MPYKRYIDDPNFRGNLEAILERLEAQETTSPLELGASILQAYSQTRFNYTYPAAPAVTTQESNLHDSHTWSRFLDSTAAYPGWDKDELEHLAESSTPLDADSMNTKGLASHRYRVSAKRPDTRQRLLDTMLEQLDDSNLVDVHLTHTVGVRCEFLVPVFWGLGTVVFRVVGTGPRGTSARAVSLSRLGWSGRWLYACRSLRYGFGGRC